MIDARNINDLAARIKQLGMGIQSGQIEGTAQNVMHLMHLKDELQKARAIQNSAMANAPKPPTVMNQVASSAVQDADQAQAQSVQDMMKQRALAMQGEMAGTGGLGSFVREPEKKMALGGAVAFAGVKGSYVDPEFLGEDTDLNKIAYKLANNIPLSPQEKVAAYKGQDTRSMGNRMALPKEQPMTIGPYTIKNATADLTKSIGGDRPVMEAPAINQPIPKGAEPYKNIINKAAGQYGVDPYLIEGIMGQESSFNPTATNPSPTSSSAGIGGFTQGTASDLGITNRYDPEQAIPGIANLLRKNLNKAEAMNPNAPYSDIRNQALTMYNQGINASPATLAENAQYGRDVENKAEAYTKGIEAPASKYTPFNAANLGQSDIQIPTLQRTQAPQLADVYSNMEISKGSTPEEERAAAEKYLGPNKGAENLRNEISKMREESASDKNKALGMALMQAGFGAMAGTSPYAMANIGQGAMKGLDAYTDSLKDYKKEQSRLVELQARADDADRQEAWNKFKYGEESSKYKNALKKSDELEVRKNKAETQFRNADLQLKQDTRDIQAQQLNLEGLKLGISDDMQKAKAVQEYLVTHPGATSEEAIKAIIPAFSVYAPITAAKTTASEFANAQDNYRAEAMEHTKNDPYTAFMSFEDYLKRRYTPSQINAMLGGERLASQEASASSKNLPPLDNASARQFIK